VIVVLINLTNEEIILPAQKKITQLIIQRYESAEPVLVDSLDDSTRGGDGFGSTGK
jgi:dUTP pyrophosphatase